MKTIGIIGAMPNEIADITSALPAAEVKTVARYDFHITSLNGNKVVYVCCGIGKVNAAVCTQVLIDTFGADCIINTGIAGGISNNAHICDIVISDDVMHHDLLARFLENYPPFNSQFKSDKVLIELAVDACKRSNMTHFVKRIVSGEEFVSSTESRNRIIEEFDPYAVDMETAAIAHCSFRNDIPFVSVRCISDNANEESDISFDEFQDIAANKVATVVLDMLGRIK